MSFNLSYTFLNTFQQCPRRAYLLYVEKVIPLSQINYRPFIAGIVVDYLFRKWIEEVHYESG